MRSERRPSARNFCARGVPDFRKFCIEIFRAIFVQNLHHLDAGLARYLELEHTPTRNRAATKFCGSRNHAGRVHAIFVRAARRNFSKTFKISFARVGRKMCVIPALDAFFFGSECNADSINSQRRCGVCTAHVELFHKRGY